jgi:Subtilase family
MPDYTRQQHQAMLIIDQFRKAGGQGASGIDTAPTPMKKATSTEEAIVWPVDYMYAKGHILVRDEHLDRARLIVRALAGQRKGPAVTPVIRGLHEVALPATISVSDALKAVRHGTDAVDRKIRRPHEGLGAGVAAPDHLISLAVRAPIPAGAGGTCPASEPDADGVGDVPVPPPAANPAAGAGVRIVVVDTGIDLDACGSHPWLHGVTGDPDPLVGDRDPLGTYAGHGTFIAGIIRTVAPAAEVHVRADFQVGGVIRESNLVRALDDVLTHDDPDIISLSAGVWSGETVGPLGFQVFYDTRLRHHKGVVLVTAAGNDASRRPFWPAAAPWTVSVGALCIDGGKRAAFSNFGGWVDVYSPGEDLVNAFPTGTYCYSEPPRVGAQADFTGGMARWSGTSFSTPLVAGKIAARMWEHGENGIDAAAALLAQARASAVPGIGAILMP